MAGKLVEGDPAGWEEFSLTPASTVMWLSVNHDCEEGVVELLITQETAEQMIRKLSDWLESQEA